MFNQNILQGFDYGEIVLRVLNLPQWILQSVNGWFIGSQSSAKWVCLVWFYPWKRFFYQILQSQGLSPLKGCWMRIRKCWRLSWAEQKRVEDRSRKKEENRLNPEKIKITKLRIRQWLTWRKPSESLCWQKLLIYKIKMFQLHNIHLDLWIFRRCSDFNQHSIKFQLDWAKGNGCSEWQNWAEK